jgi:hypothetical protein
MADMRTAPVELNIQSPTKFNSNGIMAKPPDIDISADNIYDIYSKF